VRDGEATRTHLFLGQAGGLGVLSNAYGTVTLLRRSLLGDLRTAWPSEHDPDWPLLARLGVEGARIESVPRALVTSAREPGTVERCPSDALLVLELIESVLPDVLDSAARAAVGLAADAARRGRVDAGRSPSRLGRLDRRLRRLVKPGSTA
jgi:hypothetical protein